MHTVVVSTRRGENGVEVKKIDHGGAVFVPAIERGVLVPFYGFGHGKIKDPVFTCPVSAIPDEVWQVLDLFLTCRAMKLPPKAGGVLDQPLIVRTAFPVLEAEIAPWDAQRNQAGQLELLVAMMGKGRR